MTYDHYLIVRIWRQDFSPWTTLVESLLIWVRFPDFPLKYYDVQVLEVFGNKIGKVVNVYMNTTHLSRGKFARMCAKMDLGKLLLPSYIIKGREYKVEYEGLHTS